MASSTTPTRRTSAGWTSSGACTSGSTARHSVATRPASGGAATTSTTASETMDMQRKRTIMSDLSGRTTVVVGASRGLGRGIARAFTWLREALLKPLPPGSRVVVVSSGAAINGSPASGGYAGAKATQRFIAAYAQEESHRANLGITVTAVLPRMTPHGEVGLAGARAY